MMSGYRTYITAALMLAVAIAKLFGIDIPGFEAVDPGLLISNAFAFAFLRAGVSRA
jgi:hypothetical protein